MANAAVEIALLIVAFSTVGILLSYYVSSQSIKKRLQGRPPLPPGSLGLPWLGETFDFVKHFNKNDMVSFFEIKQAKYGQNFKTKILGAPLVVLGTPAGNKFILSNEGKLVENSYPSAALNGADSMTMKRAQQYKIARRHTYSAFSPVAVMQYLPMLEQMTRDHLASFWKPPVGMEEGEDFQVLTHDAIKILAFEMIAGLCLSLGQGSELDELYRILTVWGKGVLQLPINIPGFAYHRALKARADFQKLLDKVMERRRMELEEGTATETQDVLSFLMTQTDESGKKKTDAEVKDDILLLLFAGHDTTSSALTMTIMFLAKHPQICQRVREEHDAIVSGRGALEDGYQLTKEDVHKMKFTWAVVQESIRLQPPATGAFREAVEDFEYNGYTILKGWRLMWTNQISHRNAKFFTNPETFDPSRFEGGSGDRVPFTYLPFGGGVRMCPGNEFAKLEMLVFLHYLTRKYTWTLCEPEEPVIRNPFPVQANGTAIKVRTTYK